MTIETNWIYLEENSSYTLLEWNDKIQALIGKYGPKAILQISAPYDAAEVWIHP